MFKEAPRLFSDVFQIKVWYRLEPGVRLKQLCGVVVVVDQEDKAEWTGRKWVHWEELGVDWEEAGVPWEEVQSGKLNC